MWFPTTAEHSHGFTGLFMQEGTPFGVEAERLAAEFTDPNGLVREDAFDRLARALECVLNGMNSARRLEIRHGDMKVDNLIMVPASSAPGCSSVKTMEGKMAILMVDFGNGLFRGPHYILPGHMDAYKLSTSKPSELASKRAVGALQNATGTNHVADEQSPGPGPQPYSLAALHARFLCAPSSVAGECHAPVYEFGGWGGTDGYIPPEYHHATSLPEFKGPRVCSYDFLPGDMWAFGVMAASIMSGKLKQAALHPSLANDKKSLCEAEMRCLWHKYLGKKARSPPQSPVPPEWEQALDFVQCIIRKDPRARITPAEALQHPFLVDARKKVQINQ
jgi:serine/threonine protein kinase